MNDLSRLLTLAATSFLLLTPDPAAALKLKKHRDLQEAIFDARDAVLPALVHVEPIVDVYSRGQKSKASVTGSGVIVDSAGHVLTNDHVVDNAQRVQCILHDKREVPATVVGRDPFTDVAVLRLELPEGQRLPRPARLGSSAGLSPGQHVIAMGSPLGLARSLSVGVVSTPDRYLAENMLPSGEMTGMFNTWIQTDAAINPGNSGGPMVDLNGRLVGINARAIPIFGENIGFAIPIDVVRRVASELIEKGRVDRSWVGVRWQHLKSLADYFGAADRGGVLVGGLMPGGPAEQAGLEAGDVVTSWNGTAVSAQFEEELPNFHYLVAHTPIGTEVKLGLLRRGEPMELVVTTERRPVSHSDETELEGWGITVRDLTPELRRRRRIESETGVFITGVRNAAPAQLSGLRGGDVIREVDGIAIENTEALLELYRRLDDEGWEELLFKARRGRAIRVALVEAGS
ncbi:MAG: trypsin-like peptidase domain-containing protein [Acidobacteriota bacterium]